MPSVTPRAVRGRVVFRCDGDEQIGAGHVARCVPLAQALVQLGWRVGFVGVYEGLASWLLVRAGMTAQPPDLEAPCGIATEECDAAIVDSYLIAPEAICDLARALPLVTVAEANRCAARGILLDYHLDRSEPPDARLLVGPSFAPLDPAFVGAGRAGREIRKVLVTLGGSRPARELLARIVPVVSSVFPEADMVVAGGAHLKIRGMSAGRVIELPSPSTLVDAVSDIDMAVTAAGLTAYEMACAGIPQVVIAIFANQRRVVKGLRESGLAGCLDLTGEDSLADLPGALESLRDPGRRARLAARGRNVFDGQGARRAATALTELFLRSRDG
jgi:UDP-2,4-diacetamido-2,4,6-trideoxy-beta-L-altropyranose hydrolase